MEPVRGRLTRAGDAPFDLGSDTMLVLVMLAADADRTVTEDAIARAVWPEADDPSVPVAAAVRDLRRYLGEETIERRDDGYQLMAPVTINANDSGFWLPESSSDATEPATESIATTAIWGPLTRPIVVLPVVVAVLLVILLLLR